MLEVQWLWHPYRKPSPFSLGVGQKCQLSKHLQCIQDDVNSVLCRYAGVAVLANFILQTTCFVAFMTLDLMRQEVIHFVAFFLITLVQPY